MVFNPMNLTGRAVLVTGASSGLGRATAILLSRLGARVLLLGRDVERLQRTRDALEGEGHDFLSFDLTRADEIPKMVADAASRFSPFSGIIHSAGLIQTKPIQFCTSADYELLYRVNVVAATQLLRGFTKLGVSHGDGGAVVLIGSVMSLVASPGLGAYAASKAALLGLVRAAALEFAKYRIRVNAILPGHVKTTGTDAVNHYSSLSPENIKQLEQKHPLGFGCPEDVACAAAFLVSDAARWITGSALVVDGGYTAH